VTDDAWDFGSGNDATLGQLHAVVPAAEELDILDDAREAEHREYVVRVMEEASTPLDEAMDDDQSVDAINDVEPIIALLCQEFGATVIGEFSTQ
jgi:hypothetical protein